MNFFSTVAAPSMSLTSVDCALQSENVLELNSKTSQNQYKIYVKFWLSMGIPAACLILPLLIWGTVYAFGRVLFHKYRKGVCGYKWYDVPALPAKKILELNLIKLKERT